MDSARMKNKKLFRNLLLSCFLILPLSCEENVMKVETGEVSHILTTTAEVTGRIISTGEGVKLYGHCFDKDPGVTTLDSKTEFGMAIGVGTYTSFLHSLEPGTKYYVRAYMNCGTTTVYGDEISFTTAQ